MGIFSGEAAIQPYRSLEPSGHLSEADRERYREFTAVNP
jgi:hypothetical protein